MLALDAYPEEPSRPRLSVSPWNCLVTPETFRVSVEAEVARHHRYLGKFGLLRMGSRDDRGSDALREAFETETRRTDTGCLLPDGSCVLLVLQVGAKQLEVIARRLREAAQAVHERYESEPVDYCWSAAPVTDRRLGADELWLALCRAYDEAKQARRLVRVAK